MKKPLIFLLFLIFTTHFFAQNYTFNLLTKYASENGFYEEKTVFSNTKDDSYFMVIREMNNIKTAILDDLKSSKQHIFKVIENNTASSEPQFKFM